MGSIAPKSGQSVEVGRGKLKWTGLPKHLGGSHRLSLKSKLDNKAFFFPFRKAPQCYHLFQEIFTLKSPPLNLGHNMC